MPTVEAALPLPEHVQGVFMNLAVSILINEYRKIIVQNKHTYRYIGIHRMYVKYIAILDIIPM